jgi:hypothetical protein
LKLIRYWFQFTSFDKPTPLNLGCGVTAESREEAIRLLEDKVFHGQSLPSVEEVIKNIDISTLDQTHVIPNMESPLIKGVWFPKGCR